MSVFLHLLVGTQGLNHVAYMPVQVQVQKLRLQHRIKPAAARSIVFLASVRAGNASN